MPGGASTPAALQPLRLLSTSDAGAKGNADTVDVDLSADGAQLTFTSEATNLDAGDADNTQDVYLKNVTTGALDLVSTSDTGTKGNDTSGDAQGAGGGDIVAFLSFATNLDPADTNGIGRSDVSVKTVATGDLQLVSSSDAGVVGNSGSGSPGVSDSGALVAFNSFATNLDPGDTDPISDVYVKTLSTVDIALVSTSDSGVKGNSESFEPTLAGSGSRVAFTSFATNLDPADTNNNPDVYVKDLASGNLVLVSASDSGVVADGGADNPSTTSAGGRVAFDTFSANLDPADADGVIDVYVKNLNSGDVQLVSTSDRGVKGNGPSTDPVISADGRRVALTSTATNLDPADTNFLPDVYVKDRQTGDLALASTTADSVHSNGVSGRAALSGQGRRVAFDTTATNLDPADQDSESDVYVAQPLVCSIGGTAGRDVLVGTAGAEVLCGRGGRDTLSGAGGADVLLGERGVDVANYAGSPAGVEVDLNLGAGSAGDAAGDLLIGVEGIAGSAFADSLFGDAGVNQIDGGSGADVLAGAPGTDTLRGDEGADFLVGGPDADRLVGGPAGAVDEDTVTYSESPTAVVVNLRLGTATGGTAEGDTFTEIDSVFGSPFEDQLTGDAGDNTLTGADGNDVLSPDAGTDTVIGGSGLDVVSYGDSPAAVTADLGTQSVSGGDANGDTIETIDGVIGSPFFADVLTGDALDNILFGLGGDDTLRGLAGQDVLNGGTGTDSCDGEPGELIVQCNP